MVTVLSGNGKFCDHAPESHSQRFFAFDHHGKIDRTGCFEGEKSKNIPEFWLYRVARAFDPARTDTSDAKIDEDLCRSWDEGISSTDQCSSCGVRRCCGRSRGSASSMSPVWSHNPQRCFINRAIRCRKQLCCPVANQDFSRFDEISQTSVTAVNFGC
jgi:hypothetical protein